MRCWDIRRCWGPKKKEKRLLEYEELIALATHTDVLNELNTYPEEYFNKYNSEWHTEYFNEELWNVLIDGEWLWTFIWDYIFGYKDWAWEEFSPL